MEDFIGIHFPIEFGESPEGFLKKYGYLIYKIIYKEPQDNPELKIEDLFRDFFQLISGNNFEKLRLYKREECAPVSYIEQILREFLGNQFKDIKIKIRFKITDQALSDLKGEKISEDIVDSLNKLKDKVYKSERNFTDALTEILGEENNETYKSTILDHAIVISIEKTGTNIEYCIGTGFPKGFGESSDDFIEKYSRLIFKIIYEYIWNSPELEAEDLFNDFYLFIAENNFKVLRQFRGDCLPTTYIGTVLRNFINGKFRKQKTGNSSKSYKITDQSLMELKGENIPENIIDSLKKLKNKTHKSKGSFTNAFRETIGDESSEAYNSLILNHTLIIPIEEADTLHDDPEGMLISIEQGELIKEALKETYLCLSEREQFIFKLTYFKDWDANEVAEFMEIKPGDVFENNRKVRDIFRAKLKEKEITIRKKDRKEKSSGENKKDQRKNESKKKKNEGDQT